MPARRPTSLRLMRAEGAPGASPRPPFGLDAWTENATDVAVEVARDEALEALTARLPAACDLHAGSQIVVMGGASRSLVKKLFGRAEPVSRTIRSTALLARGYVAIEAFVDEASGDDLVIGHAGR